MAQNKKSVLLYCDIIHTVEPLTDEEAGKLFKHYLRYINDKNPEPVDRLTGLLFEPIKQTLKRDLKKWELFVEKQRVNGKKGGLAKASQAQPDLANLAVIDKVIVIDKVKENNIDERKLKFASTLEPFLSKYGKDMLNDFYKYWTEPNKSGTKFRQELEKTWSLERRLETWSNNDKGFKKVSTEPTKKRKQFNLDV